MMQHIVTCTGDAMRNDCLCSTRFELAFCDLSLHVPAVSKFVVFALTMLHSASNASQFNCFLNGCCSMSAANKHLIIPSSKYFAAVSCITCRLVSDCQHGRWFQMVIDSVRDCGSIDGCRPIHCDSLHTVTHAAHKTCVYCYVYCHRHALHLPDSRVQLILQSTAMAHLTVELNCKQVYAAQTYAE